MPQKVQIRFLKGGGIRSIHTDRHDLSVHGDVTTRRASHVEPIEAGPNKNKWFVDMSPLGQEFQFCLWPPFERRDVALNAEHDFIVTNFIEKVG